MAAKSTVILDYPPGATPFRHNYITALQAADARDMAPLLAFARS